MLFYCNPYNTKPTVPNVFEFRLIQVKYPYLVTHSRAGIRDSKTFWSNTKSFFVIFSFFLLSFLLLFVYLNLSFLPDRSCPKKDDVLQIICCRSFVADHLRRKKKISFSYHSYVDGGA